MPLVQVDATGHKEEYSTEQCLAKDLCPECGHSLITESPAAHLNQHWQGGTYLLGRSVEARARREALQGYITKRIAGAAKASEADKPAAPAESKKE